MKVCTCQVEDLKQGLCHAVIVVEVPLAMHNGSVGNDGRLHRRQSFLGMSAAFKLQ